MNSKNSEQGQSLIELIIAIALFATVLLGLSLFIFDSYNAGRLALEITKADFLAEEGLEAAKSIRDNKFSDLSAGLHGLVVSNSHWVFQGVEENISLQLNNGKRVISIEDIDSNRKKITSSVTWDFTGSRPEEIKLVSYLTNWQKGIEIKKSTAHTDNTNWTNPARAYNYPDTPNDQSDSGSDTSIQDRDPAIIFRSWAAKTETYTETFLKVNWSTNGRHSNDQFAIRYTKNGGTNWQDMVSMGIHNETTIQTSIINLDNNQDLSLVQVKVVSDRVGGADGGRLYIYDIWAEGTY